MSETLAQRLARMRVEHNLSQEQLANTIGVSRQAVSKWERGEATPDTDNLVALADEYAVSLDELIRGQHPEQPADEPVSKLEPAPEPASELEPVPELDGLPEPEADEGLETEELEEVAEPTEEEHDVHAGPIPPQADYAYDPAILDTDKPVFPSAAPPKRHRWPRILGIALLVIVLLRVVGCTLGLVLYTVVPTSSTSDASERFIDADSVHDISIDWTAGSVNVVVADDEESEEVIVSESSKNGWRNMPHMVVDQEGGMLSIWYGRQSGGILGCTQLFGKDLTVIIPRSCAERLGLLLIDGASGEYYVDGVTCEQLAVDFSSGSFLGEAITADSLEIDLSSGDVTFSGAVRDTLDVGISSGNVDVATTVTPEVGFIDVASGDVVLTLPSDAGFTADVDVSSGDFSCDFPSSRSDGKTVVGDGHMALTVDISSGSVQVASGQ